MGADTAEDCEATDVSYTVASNPPGAFGGDQPVGAETHEVLADGRLWALQLGSELRDLERTSLQGLDDAESIRMRERAQSSRAVAEDFGVERSRLCHIQKFECIIHEVK
jgi:hypothetical protein